MSVISQVRRLFGQHRKPNEVLELQERISQLANQQVAFSNDLASRINEMQAEVLKVIKKNHQDSRQDLDRVYDSLAKLHVALEEFDSSGLLQLPDRIGRVEKSTQGIEKSVALVKQEVKLLQDGSVQGGYSPPPDRGPVRGSTIHQPPYQPSDSKSTKSRGGVCKPLEWWQWLGVLALGLAAAVLAILISPDGFLGLIDEVWWFAIGLIAGLATITLIYVWLANRCHRNQAPSRGGANP